MIAKTISMSPVIFMAIGIVSLVVGRSLTRSSR
jgi:hypothetical protein